MRLFRALGVSTVSVTVVCSARDLPAVPNNTMADSFEAASQREDYSSLENTEDEPLSASSSRSEGSTRMHTAMQAILPATLAANLVLLVYLAFQRKKKDEPELEIMDQSLRMRPLPTQDVVHISVRDLPLALSKHVLALGGRTSFMTPEFVLVFSPDYSQDFETTLTYLDGDLKEAEKSIVAGLIPIFQEPVAYAEKVVEVRVTDDCQLTMKLRFLPKSEFLQERTSQ